MENSSLFPKPTVIEPDLLSYLNQCKDMSVISLLDVNQVLGILRFIKESRDKIKTSQMNAVLEVESRFKPVFDKFDEVESSLRKRIENYVLLNETQFSDKVAEDDSNKTKFRRELENGKIEICKTKSIKIISSSPKEQKGNS